MKTISFCLIMLAVTLIARTQSADAPRRTGPPAPGAGSEVSLGRNYTVELRITRDGTNTLDFKWVTAQQRFKLSSDKPLLTFTGHLTIQPDGKGYLEYEVTSGSQTNEVVKPAGKSQANGHLLNSGFNLITWLSNSPMQYAPNLSDESRTGQKTSLTASAFLELGVPITLMATDRDVYTLRVARLAGPGAP